MKSFVEEDFVFLESGELFIIEKDRGGFLSNFIGIDRPSAQKVFDSDFKVTIINGSGEVVKQNFVSRNGKSMDMVKDFLSEVTESYDNKIKAIDNALSVGDKETFIRLTDELYGGTSNGVH